MISIVQAIDAFGLNRESPKVNDYKAQKAQEEKTVIFSEVLDEEFERLNDERKKVTD